MEHPPSRVPPPPRAVTKYVVGKLPGNAIPRASLSPPHRYYPPSHSPPLLSLVPPPPIAQD
eukprot:1957521-Pyramimonas_sp.AAC.1